MSGEGPKYRAEQDAAYEAQLRERAVLEALANTAEKFDGCCGHTHWDKVDAKKFIQSLVGGGYRIEKDS